MANRDVAKNGSDVRVTTTSATYQDALTLTWTPSAASTDYWLLWSSIVDYSATTADTQVKFIDSTAPADLCIQNIKPKDTTDFFGVSGLAKWTSPGTPVSQSFKIQYASEAGGTAGCNEMVIWAIESHADDEYIETDAETTTTSTSSQDAQTLTFTPASQGDYLIIAYGETSSNAVNGVVCLLEVDGAQTHLVVPSEISDITNYAPWMAVHKVNLTAASHDIKIRYRSISGAITARIRRRRILAIRLDTLRANYSDYTAARATTTNTVSSPVDTASVTFTADGSVDYFAIGSQILDGSAINLSVNARLVMDGAGSGLHTREPSNTTYEKAWVSLDAVAFASGSRTVKTQVFSETASITTGYAYRGVYVLDLREATAGYSLAIDSGSFTLTGGANSLIKASKIINSNGAFTFTGQNVGLKRGLKLALDNGSFTFTGQDVDLIYTPNTGYTLAIDNGAFAFSGGDVAFRRSLILPIGSGSYTFTGQNINLNKGFILSLSGEIFTVTGQPTGLYAGKLLSAASGSFALTGQDLSFVKGYLFSLASGSFNLTGNDLGFIRGLVIPLESGDFDLTGQEIALNHGYILTSSGGNYNLTGGSVDFKYYLSLLTQMQGTSEVEFDTTALIRALETSLDGRSELRLTLRRPVSYNDVQGFKGSRVIAEFRA